MKYLIGMLMIGILAGASPLASSSQKKRKPAHAQNLLDKKNCSSRELKLKNCDLKLGTTRVNLLKERWRFNDSQNLAVQDLPLMEPEVSWEKVTLEKWGERRLLQVWLWSKPAGESEVQELNWCVYELQDQESPLRLKEVVQRRRKMSLAVEKTEEPKPTRSLASVNKEKFVFDPPEKTQIYLEKGQLKWKIGSRHGDFTQEEPK